MCLFLLHDLPDCDVELLTIHPDLRDLPERTALLDSLTPDGTYAEYLSAFEREPQTWYPLRQHPSPQTEVTELLGRLAQLEAAHRASEERNNALDERNQVLSNRVQRLEERFEWLRGKIKRRQA